MNKAELTNATEAVTQAVLENGRVALGDEHSLWVEVEYEARERGYTNSEEIADWAVCCLGSMV